MLTFVSNVILLTKTQALIASLFALLVVTSMQQIFGGPGRAGYTPLHNEVYKINPWSAFCLRASESWRAVPY